MLKKLYRHLFCQPHMERRIPVLLLSVILMGMCVAFFEKLRVGTDPSTVLNLSFAQNVLGWEGLGTWQFIFNLILLVIILLLKEGRFIGLGSLANMVLVGYSRDFFKPVVPQIIAAHTKKVPFAPIRIGYDTLMTAIGVLLGGQIGLFTVAACLFLGPVIQWIADKFRPWFQ